MDLRTSLSLTAPSEKNRVGGKCAQLRSRCTRAARRTPESSFVSLASAERQTLPVWQMDGRVRLPEVFRSLGQQNSKKPLDSPLSYILT